VLSLGSDEVGLHGSNPDFVHFSLFQWNFRYVQLRLLYKGRKYSEKFENVLT
jgi:hypothetical protein